MDTYDISKNDGQWTLMKDGSDDAVRNFDTKREAVSFARDYVQTWGGHLRIWNADGSVLQEERTYLIEAGDEKARIEPESAEGQGSGLFDGIIKGAADASEAAGWLLPAAGKYLSRGVYETSYYAAYGVVFAAMAVGKAIPLPAPLARGVHDGTEAAMDAYEKGHSEIPKDAAAS